jgi:hypothetical protein
MLCDWANIILLAKSSHGKHIDRDFEHKINKDFRIGDDMRQKVKKQLSKIGL